MIYAKIDNGVVTHYPYSVAALRADHPLTSFPANMTPEVLAEFGVVEVIPSDPPASDPLTQTVEETLPTLNDGQWWQVWLVRQATPEEAAAAGSALKARMVQAIQDHLDAEARSRGYDSILSLASYATSSNPHFSLEGRAGADWRDAVWAHGFAVLDAVQAATRSAPTAAELIAELPQMVWPS